MKIIYNFDDKLKGWQHTGSNPLLNLVSSEESILLILEGRKSFNQTQTVKVYPWNEKSFNYQDTDEIKELKKIVEELVNEVLEVVVGEGSSFEAPTASLNFKNQWKEIPNGKNEQHKALWTYDLDGSLNPLFGITAQVSLIEWIATKYTKIVAKAYKIIQKFPKLYKPLKKFFGYVKDKYTKFKNKITGSKTYKELADRTEGDFDIKGSLTMRPAYNVNSYRTIDSYLLKQGPNGYVVSGGGENEYVATLSSDAKFVVNGAGFDLSGSLNFGFKVFVNYMIESNILYMEFGMSNLQVTFKGKSKMKLGYMEDILEKKHVDKLEDDMVYQGESVFEPLDGLEWTKQKIKLFDFN